MKQVEIDKGMSLWNAVAKAKEIAYEGGYGIVQIVFNDIKLLISEDSQDDILQKYIVLNVNAENMRNESHCTS